MSARAKIVLLIVLIVVGAAIGRTSLGDRFEAATLIATMRGLGTSSAAIPLFFLIFGVATLAFHPGGGPDGDRRA